MAIAEEEPQTEEATEAVENETLGETEADGPKVTESPDGGEAPAGEISTPAGAVQTPPLPGMPSQIGDKQPEPTEKLKFTVDGQEREFERAKVQEILNQQDFLKKATQKYQEASDLRKEADRARKEAEQMKADVEAIARYIKTNPLDVLKDLYIAELGDEESAIDAVLRVLEPGLKPIYEEMQLEPEKRKIRRIEREKQRLQETLRKKEEKEREDAKKRDEEEQTKSQRQKELEFENKVVEEMRKLNVPNDGYSEYIYRAATKHARDIGLELTPSQAAEIIRIERAKAGTDKKAPDQPPPEKKRQENLAKAKELQAKQTQSVGQRLQKPATPSAEKAPKRVSWDELWSKLES